MESVGVSELRANLTKFLQKVEAGQVIVITSKGNEVAKLVPPDYAFVAARKQLEHLSQTAVVGDVLAPVEAVWDAAT